MRRGNYTILSMHSYSDEGISLVVTCMLCALAPTSINHHDEEKILWVEELITNNLKVSSSGKFPAGRVEL
jgi:hypothetical protein